MSLKRAILPLVIASTLASQLALAQDEECKELDSTPPGLYVTTDEGLTFLSKDGKTVELAAGQAGYASETQLNCIKRVPEFLDWPCSLDAAQSRKFATYKITELKSGNTIKQVVEHYFEIPKVIEPIPNWVDGEHIVKLNFNDIVPFSSPEYWYLVDPSVDILHEKRPKTLLISLYVGINKVVIDNYAVDALNKLYGGKDIPVVFVFNDSNQVPVSYFGANVSLEEISKAFNERKIKLADVPMWPLGDHHMKVTAEEFEKYFDLPELSEIDAMRRVALEAELDVFGFSKKPVFVTLLEGGSMYVDDPERVRVALSMGMERLPIVIIFVEPDSHLARCGPGTPVGSGGVSGATTPIGGANPPAGTVVTPTPTPTSPPAVVDPRAVDPPPPPPPASDS